MREPQDHTPLATSRSPTAPEVKAFLLANADQFSGDPELLAALLPPQDDGNVVDMQRHVIIRLRQEIATVRGQGQAFIAAAAANLVAQERVHAAVLRLLEARTFGQFIRVISTDLASLMNADVAVLCIEAPDHEDLPAAPPAGVAILSEGAVDKVLGPSNRHVLNAGRKLLPDAYGRVARKVRSEALLRLTFDGSAASGLIILGSFDPSTFAPDQRIELLEFLSRVVERAMRTWLGLRTS